MENYFFPTHFSTFYFLIFIQEKKRKENAASFSIAGMKLKKNKYIKKTPWTSINVQILQDVKFFFI